MQGKDKPNAKLHGQSAKGRNGNTTVGVPLAVEMFNGRRTVRCRQCDTHLYIPITSAQNPQFQCKTCRLVMVDPLWAPARAHASSTGSSNTTITVETASSGVDSSVEEGLSDSNSEFSECGEKSEGKTMDVTLEDNEWILVNGASSFMSNSSRKRQDDNLVVIAESPTRQSNSRFFDDDVELMETHF